MEITKTQANTSFIISETAKPSSFEFGKSGSRQKIYYKDPEDLNNQIKALKKLSLIDLEGKPTIPTSLNGN